MKMKLSRLCFINELVKKTGWYRRAIPDMDNYPTNDWYRKNLQRNYDVVNIGSTSARYAFDYTGLPVKAFNWAEQPQALSYGYKVLCKYYGILKKCGTVVISLGPFSGFDVSGKWPKDANDRYFYILDSYSIDDYKAVRRRRRWPLYANFKSAVTALKKEWLGGGRTVKEGSGDCVDFEADARKWMSRWLEEFGMDSLDGALSEENAVGRKKRGALLREIVTFCRERGLRPVIVIPPMHNALTELFTGEFVQKNIVSFVAEAAGDDCEFYNYMYDDAFRQDGYFRNAFMLNETGARAFTEELLKRLGLI